MFGARATGCSPVAKAFDDGHDWIQPVRPDTIARSLAIGNPADGPYVLDAVRRTGGAEGPAVGWSRAPRSPGGGGGAPSFVCEVRFLGIEARGRGRTKRESKRGAVARWLRSEELQASVGDDGATQPAGGHMKCSRP